MPIKRRKEKRVGERTSARETERPLALWRLFLHVFSYPLGLPYVSWASQECCLFYLRSSIRSSDLPLFHLLGFSLPCLLATAILDSCFLF